MISVIATIAGLGAIGLGIMLGVSHVVADRPEDWWASSSDGPSLAAVAALGAGFALVAYGIIEGVLGFFSLVLA
jgi:hypothetical protein